ncbi:MAG: hypothetical protein LBR22_10895 [Desulfovibrio sp.]|nr:hypothetical protein [Desulfovibrio sp.]
MAVHTDDEHVLVYFSERAPVTDILEFATHGGMVEFTDHPVASPSGEEYVYVLSLHREKVLDIFLVGKFEDGDQERGMLRRYTKKVMRLMEIDSKQLARALLAQRRSVFDGCVQRDTEGELADLDEEMRRLRGEYVRKLGFHGYSWVNGRQVQYCIDMRGREKGLRLFRAPRMGLPLGSPMTQ